MITKKQEEESLKILKKLKKNIEKSQVKGCAFYDPFRKTILESGISAQVYWKWINGKTSMNKKSLEIVEKVLNKIL